MGKKICVGPIGSYSTHHYKTIRVLPEIKDGGEHIGLYRDEERECKNCGAKAMAQRLVMSPGLGARGGTVLKTKKVSKFPNPWDEIG